MTLPDHALTIEGGCNCKAIRYRVSIPAKAFRPIYPGHGDQVDPPVQMPFTCTDHCNDCRSATGALLPTWLLTPISMVTASLVKTSSISSSFGRLAKDAERGPWLPASDIFCADEPDPESTLKFFYATKARRRSFCSRCGTMFAYQVFPKLDFVEFDMLDIVLGTVDREYLENGGLMPVRQLWWKAGIQWIQEFTKRGIRGPIHETWSVAKEVEQE